MGWRVDTFRTRQLHQPGDFVCASVGIGWGGRSGECNCSAVGI
jgi:hypothetical protein